MSDIGSKMDGQGWNCRVRNVYYNHVQNLLSTADFAVHCRLAASAILPFTLSGLGLPLNTTQ